MVKSKESLVKKLENKERESGIELFRIISMILIIAHHYVVNSGVVSIFRLNPLSANSIFLALFGAWGKTGINCFVLITGYFMCKSQISTKKFLKLFLELMFYKIVIYLIFVITGYEQVSLNGVVKAILPFTSIASNFTGCYLMFFLLIPFLNVLVKNLNERQHVLLLCVTLFIYTIIGTLPKFTVVMNYVSWYIVLYFIASYIRLYPKRIYEKTVVWGILALLSFIISALSVVAITYLAAKLDKSINYQYYLLSDSNKILAVITAVCAFMFFKNLKFKCKFINAVASTTFGVLLIHANGDIMRKWLWFDTVKVVESINTQYAILHAILSVLIIFVVCAIIDYLRIILIEKPLFKKLDNVCLKVDDFIAHGKNKDKTI